jgi:hypothetical protein
MPEWLVLTVGIIVTVALLVTWIVVSIVLRRRGKTSTPPPEGRSAFNLTERERSLAEGLSSEGRNTPPP